MTPIYPTTWQTHPASGFEDLLDYLYSLALTPEQLKIGEAYLRPELMKFCAIEDCDRQQYTRKLCKPHYEKQLAKDKKAKLELQRVSAGDNS